MPQAPSNGREQLPLDNDEVPGDQACASGYTVPPGFLQRITDAMKAHSTMRTIANPSALAVVVNPPLPVANLGGQADAAAPAPAPATPNSGSPADAPTGGDGSAAIGGPSQ